MDESEMMRPVDERRERVKVTPYFYVDTLQRARATVAALRGKVPEARSLNALIDAALTSWCEALENQHNAGRRFPPVEEMPGSGGRRGGRPAGEAVEG